MGNDDSNIFITGFYGIILFAGMLKNGDGRVYKPIEKPLLGEREITFYERLQETTDPLMLELRQYTPQYYGTKELQLGNKCI